MNFTLAQWQSDTQTHYQELDQWLGRSKGTPLAAYGLLTTLTLWPLLHYVKTLAAQKRPFDLELYILVGGIVQGDGATQLVTFLQAWHGRAQQEPNLQVAHALQLITDQATDPAWRTLFDTLLQQFDALQTVQVQLPPQTYQSFLTDLAQELNQLGNLNEFKAVIEGSGNYVVQADGNAVIARDGGLGIGGDVYGDVNIQQIIQDPTKSEEGVLRAQYLERLVQERNQLSLATSPQLAGEKTAQFKLSTVYTALLTTTMSPEDSSRPLSVLDQLDQHNRLVILGRSGSGKSTFLDFVTICFAGAELNHPLLNRDLLTASWRHDLGAAVHQKWTHVIPLPVHIVLRDFVANLGQITGRPSADDLWRYIEAQFHDVALGEYYPYLLKELREVGGLLLFDGLDEVPATDGRREIIAQIIDDVAKSFAKCRIVLTSRPHSYHQLATQLTGFTDVTLAPFTDMQIRQFADYWYRLMATSGKLTQETARGRATLLKNAILNNPNLLDLARQPLVLTMMATLHTGRGGSLAENREELYAQAVDLLLDSWERQRVVQTADGQVDIIQPSLEQYLAIGRQAIYGLLERLAYEAHSGQDSLSGTADIPEEKLIAGLYNLSQKQAIQLPKLVEYLSERTGMLINRGNKLYGFPHRTFQEYLAARYLTESDLFPMELAQLACSDPYRWREVVLLAGAKAARGTSREMWALAQELCYDEPNDHSEQVWGAHLAGQLLAESADLSRVSRGWQRTLDLVKRWLVYLIGSDHLPTAERVLAGFHLGRLGDVRPEVLDVDQMTLCYVPAGDFWLGASDSEEAPLAQLASPEGYWISQYPVTFAQFQQFIDAGGYADQSLWPELQREKRWRDGKIRRLLHEWVDGPVEKGLSNQPVCGISWYEAQAFVRWLDRRWKAAGYLPAGATVQLPSEAEWEKAARGGVQILGEPLIHRIQNLPIQPTFTLISNPHPQRRYPWRDETVSLTEQVNFAETHLAKPVSVGCFMGAQSVYGCADLLGNLHEWTRSRWEAYPYDPADGREVVRRSTGRSTVLRGYSYRSGRDLIRISGRYRDFPDQAQPLYGFRVAIIPV